MSESPTIERENAADIIDPIDYADFSSQLLEMMLKKHLERAASIAESTDTDAVVDKAFAEVQAVKIELALQQRRA